MFHLTVTFAGLCLLVPNQTPGMLHVLMPRSTGHTPHIPTLVYVDQNGDVRCPEISGMHLDLPEILTGEFGHAVGSEVINFRDSIFGGRTVPRELLGEGALPDPVRARMRLRAGKYSRARRRGGFWKLPSDSGPVSRRFPTAVDWVIPNVKGTSLKIQNKLGQESFTVFPDRNNAIHILVVNVTQEELDVIGPDIPPHTKCPDDDDPAAHMELYRDLLSPAEDFPLPEFDGPRSRREGICPPQQSGATQSNSPVQVPPVASKPAPSDSAGCAHPAHDTSSAAAAGSELTCMVATAPPG